MSTNPYVRHDSQIVIGVEDSQGTTVTPTRTVGRLNGDTDMPDPEVDWQEERSIDAGSTRELSGKEPGQNTYEGGSLPVLPHDGLPIALLFGEDSVQTDTGLDATGSTTSDTGTTLHTMTVNDTDLPPTVTIEATYFGRGSGGEDFVRTFAGATPPSGTISTDNESRLQCEMDMLAMGVSPGTSPTTGISEPSRSPWLFHDVESDLSIAGTSYARLTNFEIEITTNISPEHYIAAASGADPYEILYGNIEYEISATIKPTDKSLYQSVLDRDDSGTMNIQFARDGGGDRLRFEGDRIGLSEAPYSFPEEGAPEVDVTITPDSLKCLVEDQQATEAYV